MPDETKKGKKDDLPEFDVDELLRDARNSVDEASDVLVPTKINSVDDALKAVDGSNLPPAPVSVRPSVSGQVVPDGNEQKVDKYGLPITPAGNHSGYKSVGNDTLVLSGSVSPDNAIVPVRSAVPARSVKAEPAALPAVIEPDVDMPDFNEPKIDKGSETFKINFDFESAYRDPPENRPLRRRRERRTGLVGGLLFALFILSVGLVLGSIMWMATMDVLGFAAANEEVNVEVPAGFTIEGVTDMLYEADLIRYKALFNLFADYSHAEEKISPGSYVLNKNYDYRALVQGMTARAGVRVETTVVIPEGFTLAQIFTLLENEEVCSAEELWDAAARHDFNFYFLEKESLGNRLRLEGFLFPDTYNFYKDSKPVQVITKMLREFDNKYTEQYVERADHLGYTVREIITIASMIEREAGSEDDRSRISAVIHNRLNNPGTYPMLEIDATIHYFIAGTGIPFRTALEMDNEFNTYLRPGLPAGPIANPGLASIQAALYPANTNDYFYALNKEGSHNFFRNATDHNNFVNSDEYGG